MQGACGPRQGGGDGSAFLGDVPIRSPYSDIREEDVIGFAPLWEAACKCKSGVLWKGSVARFWKDAARNVYKLSRDLHDGTYVPGNPISFCVKFPKPRDILGMPYRDRVYQRSLNDVLLYPVISRSWIFDNAACQVGKGTDFSRNRFAGHIRRHYREHDICGGVLCLDVKGYYDNLPHWHVRERFRRKLPDWGFRRAMDVLDSQYLGDKGYSPGSQIVQIAGVDALDHVDHFVKEELGIRGYCRYMDDLRLVHHDIRYLEECWNRIDGELESIGLRSHPDKTRVMMLTDKIPYLGFAFRLTGTGKVVTEVDPAFFARTRKRIRRLSKLEAKGLREPGTTGNSFECSMAHLAKHGTWAEQEALREWYKTLEVRR